VIERIPYPNALFTEMGDYVKQNNLIKTGFLRVNDPWPVVGGNIVRGSVFQIGGTVYLATSDTVIGGVQSAYVKLTPSGDGSTCAPTYVANLAGVSWNDAYNIYDDVGGNLYVFDEVLAVCNGELAAYNTRLAYATRYDYAIYQDSADVETLKRIDTKIIEIGDWNMDGTASVSIDCNLDNTKIRDIQVIIRQDSSFGVARETFPIDHGLGNVVNGRWFFSYADSNISLTRSTDGFFDNADFDEITYNRGWITIKYEI